MTPIKLPLFVTLIIGLLISACKKETETGDVEDPGTTTTVIRSNNIDSNFYFKGTIDGTEVKIYPDTIYTMTIGDSSSKKTLSGYYEYSPFSIVIKKTAFANPTPANLANSGGAAFILDTTASLNSAGYRNIIQVKSYSYGRLSKGTVKGASGAYIMYHDANGIAWTSDKGTADQTGSTFIVTSYADNATKAPFKKVKASFSCKLYDGLGNSKTITNGSFSAQIITF